jgi:competence protein ComFB
MIVLKNYTEEVVKQNLDCIVNQIGCCTCEVCKMDIMAIALNRLKPNYVATEIGELYSKLNDMAIQSKADVVSAIMQGAEIVKTNPRRHPPANG